MHIFEKLSTFPQGVYEKNEEKKNEVNLIILQKSIWLVLFHILAQFGSEKLLHC